MIWDWIKSRFLPEMKLGLNKFRVTLDAARRALQSGDDTSTKNPQLNLQPGDRAKQKLHIQNGEARCTEAIQSKSDRRHDAYVYLVLLGDTPHCERRCVFFRKRPIP